MRDWLGHGVVIALGLGLIVLLPGQAQLYTVINATIWAAMATLALSLGLVWGYGGILCLGQTAFFGLGGYAYAVAAINFGDTTWAVPLAIATPALFAAMLGYFLFYGRLGDVYLGVVTLTVSLILFKLANSTSGPEYTIGSARLGGFNGMPATPFLNAPFDAALPLSPEDIFRAVMAALVLCYVICLWLLRSRFGRVAVAIRENPQRAELLGYDARRHKLLLFTIGGAIAGVAGVGFANSVFISPALFSLATTAQVIIWVIVGGLGTLFGPILGAVVVQALMSWLGTLEQLHPALARLDPNFVLGAILILFVLLLPRGLWPAVCALAGRLRR
jgi:ABC-type branched-subunit amino acid transport system permease subunit